MTATDDQAGTAPYAPPREVTDIADCYFYHTTDIPGHGLVHGEWDLRGNIDAYLGNFEFRGKRVLDVGAASGFLTFSAEKAGAEVVSYDLSPAQRWDIVPHAKLDRAATDADRSRHLQRLNNGYWFCHAANRSKARLVHGAVYDIPASIGPVDVAIYGSILLHVRDPFLALENGARLAREAVIVADVPPLGLLGAMMRAPRFQPESAKPSLHDTWWNLPPRLVREYLAVLGFPKAVTTWHRQKFIQGDKWLYTVVARR